MATEDRKPGPPAQPVVSWVSEAFSADERDAFWRRVADFETAPTTTDFQRLTDAGVELPDPVTLSEAEFTTKLWEVIDALAGLDVYLTSTNHLSDPELYSCLWLDLLRVDDPIMPGSTTHLDILGRCGEEDMQLPPSIATTDCRSRIDT